MRPTISGNGTAPVSEAATGPIVTMRMIRAELQGRAELKRARDRCYRARQGRSVFVVDRLRRVELVEHRRGNGRNRAQVVA
jgi:hypothetical protein